MELVELVNRIGDVISVGESVVGQISYTNDSGRGEGGKITFSYEFLNRRAFHESFYDSDDEIAHSSSSKMETARSVLRGYLENDTRKGVVLYSFNEKEGFEDVKVYCDPEEFWDDGDYRDLKHREELIKSDLY